MFTTPKVLAFVEIRWKVTSKASHKRALLSHNAPRFSRERFQVASPSLEKVTTMHLTSALQSKGPSWRCKNIDVEEVAKHCVVLMVLLNRHVTGNSLLYCGLSVCD